MFIQLDVFARLLGVSRDYLLKASLTDGLLEGYPLPTRHQIPGAAVMFDFDEVQAFIAQWNAGKQISRPSVPNGVLLSLEDVAKLAGIAPLALWQAINTGRNLKGFIIPAAIKSSAGNLMFEASAVAIFVNDWHKTYPKK